MPARYKLWLCDRLCRMSVRPSVCQKSVFHRNEWTDRPHSWHMHELHSTDKLALVPCCGLLQVLTCRQMLDFSARCNIYISRLCYDVSVRLSVRLSVTEVHWLIIANLGFKFRSQFTANCGRGACGREGRDHRREEWRGHLALCC